MATAGFVRPLLPAAFKSPAFAEIRPHYFGSGWNLNPGLAVPQSAALSSRLGNKYTNMVIK